MLSTSQKLKFTLREPADELAYAQAREAGNLPPCRYCIQKNVVKEYAHFLIMQNDFPYTRIAKVNHMLSPKRHVASLEELTSEELAELWALYNDFNEHRDPELPAYDLIAKNTIRNMTIPGHLHLHLIQFKDAM